MTTHFNIGKSEISGTWKGQLDLPKRSSMYTKQRMQEGKERIRNENIVIFSL